MDDWILESTRPQKCVKFFGEYHQILSKVIIERSCLMINLAHELVEAGDDSDYKSDFDSDEEETDDVFNKISKY